MPDFCSIKNALESGGFFTKKTWKISPDAYRLSPEEIAELENIGTAALAFYRALEKLYLASAENRSLLRNGKLFAPWVSEILNRGKPPRLVAHQRTRALAGTLPPVIRPDLLVCEDGFALTELDSVPGGIGLTAFLNRTAWECERMLAKLRRGEQLTGEDFDTLERLYAANHAVRTELDKTLATMTDESLQEFIKKGTGGIADAMQRIEKSTLEENRAEMERGMEKMKEKMKNVKDKIQEKVEEMTKKTGAEMSGKDMPHIESARAEQLCKEYFSDYDIAQYQCVGETVTRQYSAYNVEGYDAKGTLLFAEISQKDGALLRFDYYEDCDADTFDLQNAEQIAEDFLDKLGYDDMEVVRYRDNGTMTDFTFVYEADDVAYYPDEVRVKVCRSRGVVTAMDATKYIHNHKERVAPSVEISMDEARARLHEKLSVEASRLAVVKTKRGERAAYEFLCSYGEENYFVYLDGVNGEEIAIVNAKGIQ